MITTCHIWECPPRLTSTSPAPWLKLMIMWFLVKCKAMTERQSLSMKMLDLRLLKQCSLNMLSITFSVNNKKPCPEGCLRRAFEKRRRMFYGQQFVECPQCQGCHSVFRASDPPLIQTQRWGGGLLSVWQPVQKHGRVIALKPPNWSN